MNAGGMRPADCSFLSTERSFCTTHVGIGKGDRSGCGVAHGTADATGTHGGGMFFAERPLDQSDACHLLSDDTEDFLPRYCSELVLKYFFKILNPNPRRCQTAFIHFDGDGWFKRLSKQTMSIDRPIK